MFLRVLQFSFFLLGFSWVPGLTVAAHPRTYAVIHQLDQFTFKRLVGQVVLLKKGVITLKFAKRNKELTSKVFMFGAVISVIFSFLGWIGADFWLASTQWLLVAAVLALFSVYLK